MSRYLQDPAGGSSEVCDGAGREVPRVQVPPSLHYGWMPMRMPQIASNSHAVAMFVSVVVATLLACLAIWVLNQFVKEVDSMIYKISRVAIILVYIFFLLRLFGIFT